MGPSPIAAAMAGPHRASRLVVEAVARPGRTDLAKMAAHRPQVAVPTGVAVVEEVQAEHPRPLAQIRAPQAAARVVMVLPARAVVRQVLRVVQVVRGRTAVEEVVGEADRRVPGTLVVAKAEAVWIGTAPMEWEEAVVAVARM